MRWEQEQLCQGISDKTLHGTLLNNYSSVKVNKEVQNDEQLAEWFKKTIALDYIPVRASTFSGKSLKRY